MGYLKEQATKENEKKGIVFRPDCVGCPDMFDNNGIAACNISNCDKPLRPEGQIHK